MKLEELTTPYETHKFLMYGTDGNKIVRHNRKVRKIAGNVYCGEPYSDGWDNVVDTYLIFDGVECGIKCNTYKTSREAEEVTAQLKSCGVDTLDGIIDRLNRAIAEEDHIPMLYVEFIKQIKPEFVPALLESRRLYDERMEKFAAKRRVKQEAEDAEYTRKRNEAAEQKVAQAIGVLKSGGILENFDVTFYKSRYESSTYSVVNYLCRKYGVKLPLKTAGWVNSCLANLTIKDGKCEHLQYYKRKKTTRASEVIYSYVNQLIAAVQADE